MPSVHKARTWISVAVAAIAGSAACHRAPGARARVLAELPGDAVVAVVADGRALAHPQLRGVLDVVAAHWPASLGCVIDAAVASDAAGLTVDGAGNTMVALALSRAPRCAPLSQRVSGLWIATLGAGPPPSAGALRDAPGLARARPYLETSPIAAVALGPELHVLAAAQPEPLDAWLAIDARSGADAVTSAVAGQLAKLAGDPRTAALAAAVRTARPAPTQIVVRVAGVPGGELAPAARALWTSLTASEPPPNPPPTAFTCPAPAPGITCAGGTRYEVESLAADLAPIVTVGRPLPVVGNGSVTGLRIAAPIPALGLVPGDVIVAMAGRVVNSRTLLADWISRARGATTVTIRRGESAVELQFSER